MTRFRDFAAIVALTAGCSSTSEAHFTNPIDADAPDASTTSVASDAATEPPDAAIGTVISNVLITWYGFDDNTCDDSSSPGCAEIAFDKSDGFPTKHDEAIEGAGTYDDPITFATACDSDGMTDCEFLPGTMIYVPEVHKYFVMEDECGECQTDWDTPPVHTYFHTDLWMGPSSGAPDPNALGACEEKLTLGDTDMGTGTIVVNPSPDFPVDTTPLFTAGNACTAKTYPANTVPALP